MLGIVWLNYNDYNLGTVHALKLKKSTIFCDKYSFYISKKIWIKSLSFFFINKNLLAGCINRKIKDNILSIYEIMEVGQLLKKKNDVYIFVSNNFFLKNINSKYYFKNLNIINGDIFKIFNYFILIFYYFLIKLFKSIFLFSFFKKEKNQKQNLNLKKMNLE